VNQEKNVNEADDAGKTENRIGSGSPFCSATFRHTGQNTGDVPSLANPNAGDPEINWATGSSETSSVPGLAD